MAEGNPDNRQQDSTAGESPDAAADGDDECCASSSNSAMADGLTSLISSVMAASIREPKPLPAAKISLPALSIVSPEHAARISGVRKRVRALNTVLKSVQRRIDNMDRMLSAGLPHAVETIAGESSKQQHAQ